MVTCRHHGGPSAAPCESPEVNAGSGLGDWRTGCSREELGDSREIWESGMVDLGGTEFKLYFQVNKALGKFRVRLPVNSK